MVNFYGQYIGFGAGGVAAPITDRGARGVWGGGTGVDIIDYITIQSGGNTTDFGDLTTARGTNEGRCSSGSRGVFMSGSGQDVMDYITIGSTGDAIDFGDVSVAGEGGSGTGNGVRGLIGATNPNITLIEYITIASTGDATTFGNLPSAGAINQKGCMGDIAADRAVWAGGVNNVGGGSNEMIYVTISSEGDSTDFGDRTISYRAPGCVSSLAGRGCMAGGRHGASQTNTIDYITIASTGNATDFGNLTVSKAWCGGCNDDTRGVFGAGYSSQNVLDYITIGSTGDASDFGDRAVYDYMAAGASGD